MINVRRYPSVRSLANVLLTAALFAALFYVNLGSARAALQEQDSTPAAENGSWDTPFNLSQSGAASEPRIVVDAAGTVHAIWREDPINTFFYASRTDGEWQTPVAVEFPFGTPRFGEAGPDGAVSLYSPHLVLDGDGRLHAFWTGERSALFYSSAPIDGLSQFENWSGRQQLATSALDFDAVVDGDDEIHLTYLRNLDTPDAPAGVYYRLLNDGDSQWSEPILIYRSAYYRAQTAAQANVDLAPAALTVEAITEPVDGEDSDSTAVSPTVDTEIVSGTGVIAVWDNVPLERVFTQPLLGEDGVQTLPAVVDRRLASDAVQSLGPSNIIVGAREDEIHLSWLAGHEGSCEQYHQWSVDGGLTWEPALMLTPNRQSCPSAHQFLSGPDGLIYLMTAFGSEVYLQGWNGERWSELERQPPLSSFTDPVTLRTVTLSCLQPAVLADQTLLVAGCGTGAVGDIWILTRPLGDEAAWFPAADSLVWKPPVSLTDNVKGAGSPLLLPSAEETTFAFWLGQVTAERESPNTRIFFARGNQSSWTEAIPLYNLGSETVDHLQGLVNGDGKVFLMWREGESNSFFFSVVDGERIQVLSDWSIPERLPLPDQVVSAPSLLLNRNGWMHVIYAVPLNEGRGIYMISTPDEGRNWTEPQRIVDGAGLGLEMVDQPHLTQTANGELHALWTSYELQPDPTPAALYYARSADGGQSWTAAIRLVESPGSWSRIVATGENGLLIFWKQSGLSQAQILLRPSFDSGRNWSQVQGVFTTDEALPPPVFAGEGASQLHILHLNQTEINNYVLENRVWEGDTWQTSERNPVFLAGGIEIPTALSAALSTDGRLAFLTVGQPAVVTPETDRSWVHATDRTVAAPIPVEGVPADPAALATPSAGSSSGNDGAAGESAAPAAGETVETAPAAAAETNEEENGTAVEAAEATGGAGGGEPLPSETTTLITVLLFGLVPAILLIVIVIIVGIRFARNRRG